LAIDAQAALANLRAVTDTVAQSVAEKDAGLNALSLQVDSLGDANVALQAELDTARATIAAQAETIAELKAKLPQDNPAPKTVKDFGAKGDGITDDTAAFQLAVNSGSLIVPPGDYLIDAVKRVSVNLNGTVVRMEAGVKLRAKPNASSRYYLLDVNASDCDIDCGGAEFYGDRLKHTFTAGSWHEHGYGVFVGGARNKVRNFSVYECTGDGVGVTGEGHEISGVVCKRNRRNGLSAFRTANLWIHDCEFSETGFLTDSTGLPGPFAGIDVEPDNGNATGIRIERIKALKNQKAAIALWVRDEVDSQLQVAITDSELGGSPNGIWGCDEAVRAPTIAATILRNKITFTSGAGVKADRGTRFTVGDSDPANANTIDSASGSRSTAVSYGIQERNGGVAVKGVTTYV
jgi:hypothetical protein